MKYLIFLLTFLLIIIACQQPSNLQNQDVIELTSEKNSGLAKFEPADAKCLVFIGQELDAIGGIENWEDGYMNHFQKPYGFTMYTDFMPESPSFGFVHNGLDGMETTDDWGDGPSNMSLQLADTDFNGMALAIGLDMKDNHEDDVADGRHDELIDRLGKFLLKHSNIEVYLRIGYEFDGHDWNSYDDKDYVLAFRRIKDKFDEMDIQNVAYVWQSKGRGCTAEDLEKYYPGDEYVDWTGFSFFASDNESHPMIEFSRKKGKPCFIAEATPVLAAPNSAEADALDFSLPGDAAKAWDNWFVPFFRTIENNPDVIKAISYINCNWKSHRMWKEVGFFNGLDVRLQLDKQLSEKWSTQMADPRYVNK